MQLHSIPQNVPANYESQLPAKETKTTTGSGTKTTEEEEPDPTSNEESINSNIIYYFNDIGIGDVAHEGRRRESSAKEEVKGANDHKGNSLGEGSETYSTLCSKSSKNKKKRKRERRKTPKNRRNQKKRKKKTRRKLVSGGSLGHGQGRTATDS